MDSSYKQAVEYVERLGRSGMRFELGRVAAVLEALGQPQETYPIIHVAGSNGKGSVCAILANVLRQAGYKTGLYTSPHLLTVRERFQIDGNYISPESFAGIFRQIQKAARKAKVKLTEFEFLTVIAFVFFHREKVHVAVVETGLGGRLDATNVIKHPALCVITTIRLEHTEWLGKTIKKIAYEKAGIIKPGVKVITGETGEALRVIERVAGRRKGIVIAPDKDFKVNLLHTDWKKGFQKIDYAGRTMALNGLKAGLLGTHQTRNAAVALAALEELRHLGWNISEENIRGGFRAVKWPGRFDIKKHGGRIVILDGAHNPDGAQALARTLAASSFARHGVNIIFGCLRDKDVHGIIKPLVKYVEKVMNVKVNSNRALEPGAAGNIWTEYGCVSHVAGNFKEAWKRLVNEPDSRRPILIYGSLYLVGEALAEETWKRL